MFGDLSKTTKLGMLMVTLIVTLFAIFVGNATADISVSSNITISKTGIIEDVEYVPETYASRSWGKGITSVKVPEKWLTLVIVDGVTYSYDNSDIYTYAKENKNTKVNCKLDNITYVTGRKEIIISDIKKGNVQ